MLLRGVSEQQAAKAITERRMHTVCMSLREGSGQQAAKILAQGYMHVMRIALRGRVRRRRQENLS